MFGVEVLGGRWRGMRRWCEGWMYEREDGWKEKRISGERGGENCI